MEVVEHYAIKSGRRGGIKWQNSAPFRINGLPTIGAVAQISEINIGGKFFQDQGLVSRYGGKKKIRALGFLTTNPVTKPTARRPSPPTRKQATPSPLFPAPVPAPKPSPQLPLIPVPDDADEPPGCLYVRETSRGLDIGNCGDSDLQLLVISINAEYTTQFPKTNRNLKAGQEVNLPMTSFPKFPVARWRKLNYQIEVVTILTSDGQHTIKLDTVP